jgi:hypothetical protein
MKVMWATNYLDLDNLLDRIPSSEWWPEYHRRREAIANVTLNVRGKKSDWKAYGERMLPMLQNLFLENDERLVKLLVQKENESETLQ